MSNETSDSFSGNALIDLKGRILLGIWFNPAASKGYLGEYPASELESFLDDVNFNSLIKDLAIMTPEQKLELKNAFLETADDLSEKQEYEKSEMKIRQLAEKIEI